MTMIVQEDRFEFRDAGSDEGLLARLERACEQHLPDGAAAVRFVVTESTVSSYQCECGVLSGLGESGRPPIGSIFEFRPRLTEDAGQFNTVLLIPTGIGAEVGGHAGDAGPVARMLAEICDTVVLHPNVVNASDLNELPSNALYVEGSVVTRLLMGTVGLSPVRSNRVLVVIDEHRDQLFVNAAVNTVSGARASYGLSAEVVCLDPPVDLRAHYAPSGRAAGSVEQLEGLCRVLEERKGTYDAVALSSVIDVPHDFHQGYFDAAGQMLNPWGGVEAMLTHTLSSMYDIPTAHSPMFESREIANMDPGIVDPRLAAEAVSETFLQCTLKGLRQSPRIVTDTDAMTRPGVFTAEDVSCLVIPDGCLGIPTLAALQQNIPVVAVRENRNVMKNDLTLLPWSPGQFHVVENYWEAAGVLATLKAGIAPDSVRRPLQYTVVEDRRDTTVGARMSQPSSPEESLATSGSVTDN